MTLVFCGYIIGLIMAFVILAFIYGVVNKFLTEAIWRVAVKSDWISTLAHGVALSILLLVVSILQLLVQSAIPGVLASALLFLVYCLVDGYLARNIVGLWIRDEPSNRGSDETLSEARPDPAVPVQTLHGLIAIASTGSPQSISLRDPVSH